MEHDKDQWADELLNSLDGIRRAEADPRLWHAIVARTRGQAAVVRQLVPLRVVLAAAASFVLLAALNWQLLHRPHPGSPAGPAAEQVLADTYGMGRNPLNLYAD